MSSPGAAVHVEFTVEDEGLAEQARGLLARLDLDFRLPSGPEHRLLQQALQTAADLLALLGAQTRACAGRSTPCSATCAGSANRLANCDKANARRAAAAGERQAAAARRLMASSGWDVAPATRRRSLSCACVTRTWV